MNPCQNIHKLLQRWIAITVLASFSCSTNKDSHQDHDDDHEQSGDQQNAHQDKHPEGVIELPEAVAKEANITTQAAKRRRLAAQISTTGTIGFDETQIAHVSPRVPGRIANVLANLGDEVKKGQPLVILDSMELGRAKADHLRAKAQLEVAKTEYDREKRLSEKKIASQKDFQDAQAAFRQATAAVQATSQALRLLGLGTKTIAGLSYNRSSSAALTLRAPLAGRVVEKHATIGELATPETKIYTIADLGKLWVLVDIYERDLSRIHLGDGARVIADAYPGQNFAGKVSYIEDHIDAHTRTLKARIEVSNMDKKLRPGMFVRVVLSDPHNIAGNAESNEVIVVPLAAVQRDGDERVVFVKTGKRRFQRRVVTLGRHSADNVEVTSGISVGEEVATSGTFILKSEAAKESMGGGHSH